MKLAELINEAYEKQRDEKPREYIGAVSLVMIAKLLLLLLYVDFLMIQSLIDCKEYLEMGIV